MSKQEATMNKIMRLSSILQIHGAIAPDNAWHLLPGQVVALDHTKGKKLACTSGRLWVTLEHDAGDFILEADQSLPIDENGRVVISALDSGAFKVA
jgi:hypothetical protein